MVKSTVPTTSAIRIVWRRWGRWSTTAGISRHVDHLGGSALPDLLVVTTWAS